MIPFFPSYQYQSNPIPTIMKMRLSTIVTTAAENPTMRPTVEKLHASGVVFAVRENFGKCVIRVGLSQ
jgi:hypothetical protein